VTINPDGTIAPITATYRGVGQLYTVDAQERIEAESIAWDSGIQDAYVGSSGVRVLPVGSDTTGQQKLTNIHNGEWTSVARVDFGSDEAGGATAISADVLPKAGGQVEVRLDSPDTSVAANLVGTLTIPASSAGGWTTVRTLRMSLWSAVPPARSTSARCPTTPPVRAGTRRAGSSAAR
jgi:arabinoxylan arabinofuranohydrolase